MKNLKNKLFYLNSFILYLALVVVFFILSIMFLEQYANSFLISNFAANKSGSDDIAEIVIDDLSQQKYDWSSNDMFAMLLDYLHTYSSPRTVGLDMLFDTLDESKSKDKAFIKQVSKMPNLVMGFTPYRLDNPREYVFKDFAKKYSLDADTDLFKKEQFYNDAILPSGDKFSYIKNYGSVMVQTSNRSGQLFSTVNLVKIGDSFYPSLPLKMYLIEKGTNKVVLNYDGISVPETGLFIPYLYNDIGITNTFIRYYKYHDNTVYSHKYFPAADIIETYKALKAGITPKTNPELYDKDNGKYINPEFFNNKTVFIGANISGPSADVFLTPMATRHPGVDIQATVYDNLMHNHFLDFAGVIGILLSFLFLSISAFIAILKTKFLKGLFSIVLIDILFMTVVCLFATNGVIVSFATPVVLQFVTVIFGYSFKFIAENRNKEKIKQAMGKYLSQDIMKKVVKNIDDLKLGGKRAVVTVLFSDIRGFTSLSEKMSAEEVSMILNEYFSEMEPIITKYNGVINKFIGDAVMAIFGEPIQDINHAQNAVKCAYDMLKKVEYLREKWLFEGKPRIEIGVGINTGEVFIGNIGTETRMEYTVIGDTVNLASRIESYNKVYKTNLLVSSSTYSSISEIADVIKISEVQIRGKAKKMNIYEVLRIDYDK